MASVITGCMTSSLHRTALFGRCHLTLSLRGTTVRRRRIHRSTHELVIATALLRSHGAWITCRSTRQVPGRGRQSEPHVRPWRGAAAHPLTLAGLRGALAVGQYRLAAAEDEPRPSGDCPAVVD